MKKIAINSWWSNFLTGVLATAIGVGLTFEVNHLVERSHQKKAQRQAAMMAIYDIDEMMRKFEVSKARGDAFFHVAMYLYVHPEELETTSMDSLWMVSEYLHYDSATMPEWFDESTEKVFTTSMDAMVHLGNIAFYRNVQECYHLRRNLMNQYAQNATFHQPVTEDFITEYRKRLSPADISSNGTMKHKALAGFVRLLFKQPEVALYLQKFHARNDVYDQFVGQIRILNQENKFIMNISDDEMKRYVDTYISKIAPAKPKLLAGTWETTRGPKTEIYDLRKNKTVTYTLSTEMQLSMHLEEEDMNVSLLTPMAFTVEGNWDLKNDTIMVQLDSTTMQILTLELDLNCLPKSYLESHRDSLEIQKNNMKAIMIESFKQEVSQPEIHPVSVSKTGNIMFWESRRTLPWGEEQIDKMQFIKRSRLKER